jgi:hypothetical protein
LEFKRFEWGVIVAHGLNVRLLLSTIKVLLDAELVDE